MTQRHDAWLVKTEAVVVWPAAGAAGAPRSRAPVGAVVILRLSSPVQHSLSFCLHRSILRRRQRRPPRTNDDVASPRASLHAPFHPISRCAGGRARGGHPPPAGMQPGAAETAGGNVPVPDRLR